MRGRYIWTSLPYLPTPFVTANIWSYIGGCNASNKGCTVCREQESNDKTKSASLLLSLCTEILNNVSD